jgi:hypothetical protein
MSRQSVFDYDAIGKRLKEIRGSDPMAPHQPHLHQEPKPAWRCDNCKETADNCYCWAY